MEYQKWPHLIKATLYLISYIKSVACSLEELDARVREYRRRIREAGGGSEVVMADGFSRSPRDSPVAAIQSVSDSIIMVTSK